MSKARKGKTASAPAASVVRSTVDSNSRRPTSFGSTFRLASSKWVSKPADAAEAIFRQTYPAIFRFMKGYELQLKARKNSVRFWWELSGSNAWPDFDKPKIMFQDITWNQRFCLETARILANNIVYFLPTSDTWLMLVLNAPISWLFMWRTAQHGKDEALRCFTDYLNAFPLANPAAEIRAEVEAAVGRLIELTRERQAGTRAVLHWLRAEFAIARPTQKLAGLVDLSVDEFIAELRKIRGKKAPAVGGCRQAPAGGTLAQRAAAAGERAGGAGVGAAALGLGK